ncbi:MAG: VOC family protein [Actinomycetota bacterium]|nr:VOC family protein [Actinomycetota bacterium]
MPALLNHHIVHAWDPQASAEYLAEMLDLAEPVAFGPFFVVECGNGVSLDYIAVGDAWDDIRPEHYAFLVDDEQFDRTHARIVERGSDYFADPGGNLRNEINTHDSGRGLYWADPNGHWLEMITTPYGVPKR